MVPSSEAMTRHPAATAGDELNPTPASNSQESLPEETSKAKIFPAVSPTKTLVPTITGELSTRPRVANRQRRDPSNVANASTARSRANDHDPLRDCGTRTIRLPTDSRNYFPGDLEFFVINGPKSAPSDPKKARPFAVAGVVPVGPSIET